MTVDEQTIVSDLMKKNGFEPADSSSDGLRFQKTENSESIQVNLLNDFPYYAEIQYADGEIPHKRAKQTLMLKNFQKVKIFAGNDVKNVVENLKQEFIKH